LKFRAHPDAELTPANIFFIIILNYGFEFFLIKKFVSRGVFMTLSNFIAYMGCGDQIKG
jgi:hypothetical protein